jgi:PIN domain nuclease of toxin-antitoxin system
MWEIAMLSSRNRIVLEEPIGRWLDQALTRSAVVVEPLSPEVAVESCELPGVFHRDPVDRMLVATARVTKATLMTRDRRILDYAAEGHLSAMQA